ncbi:putative small GTP-binding protein [Trypanosoma cruzi]|uniref:Small GTP-binding protein, putative n=2 Tax=Trypanosoma cruzi TaxID=5693 RepID=Q4DVL3_TRYCC|nr:small GTP-binding protein, putative [Trypanosoma cruzi]EAN96574.1 small GTP-binding protein, putative [Trypanosoma cruzi]PWV04929.1 putative small GTP-binding protein [Trypanosoma cruzi]RNC60891.1 putative mitochondrial Gtp-binding protein-like protein [Trypanosoma cruzi]|eukprot:XP_818425.1 small GTP-binding protein [Trypanosoma cruzi strain CL Brener]
MRRFCIVNALRSSGVVFLTTATPPSTNSTAAANNAMKSSQFALPLNRQIRHGLSSDWREQVRRSGGVLNDISPALPDSNRTDDQRKRVAGWQPVVKLLGDQRLRVAIVGRMNSGKSSLFNLLSEDPTMPNRKNIVRDFDGITRDSVEGHAQLEGMHFTIIDTPGMVNGKLVEEAFRTVETADAAIFVTSVDEDLHSAEFDLIHYLQLKCMPTFVLVNKMDLVPLDEEDRVLERYNGLGLGNAIPFSARRKSGMEMLAAVLEPLYHIHSMQKVENDWDIEDLAMQGDESAMEEIRDRNCADRFIRIALVGRTNSGKSSLINRLVGFERSRAVDEKNSTRDPVELSCIYKGRKVKLIDTAGLTRHRFRADRDFIGRIHDLSVNEIRYAHVVIVVFDATEGHPNKYDMAVLHSVAAEGRPFLLCANKWDAVLDQSATAEAIDFKIKRQVREVKYSNAVVVSAHTGLNLTLLMDQALLLYDTWNKRVRRAELTRLWRKMEKSVIIPYHVARVGRITQVNTRPPTFLLHLQTKNDENTLPKALQEMMKNTIVEEFDFRGVPIRLIQEVKDSNPDYI